MKLEYSKLTWCQLTGNYLDVAVQVSALALQGVNDVDGGHSLPLAMLGVSDGVADEGLQPGLQHLAGVLVDVGADPLDASSASQTADSRLGDSVQDGSLPLVAAALSHGHLALTFAFGCYFAFCHFRLMQTEF